MPLHVSSTRAHRLEAKIILYSYYVLILTELYFSNFSNIRPLTRFSVMKPEAV